MCVCVYTRAWRDTQSLHWNTPRGLLAHHHDLRRAHEMRTRTTSRGAAPTVQSGSPNTPNFAQKEMNYVNVSKNVSCLCFPRWTMGNGLANANIQQPPRLGTRGFGDGCHPHKTQFQFPDGARTTEIVSSTSSNFASLFVGCEHGGGTLSCFAQISS